MFSIYDLHHFVQLKVQGSFPNSGNLEVVGFELATFCSVSQYFGYWILGHDLESLGCLLKIRKEQHIWTPAGTELIKKRTFTLNDKSTKKEKKKLL